MEKISPFIPPVFVENSDTISGNDLVEEDGLDDRLS
jgi:hypothetical protein